MITMFLNKDCPKSKLVSQYLRDNIMGLQRLMKFSFVLIDQTNHYYYMQRGVTATPALLCGNRIEIGESKILKWLNVALHSEVKRGEEQSWEDIVKREAKKVQVKVTGGKMQKTTITEIDEDEDDVKQKVFMQRVEMMKRGSKAPTMDRQEELAKTYPRKAKETDPEPSDDQCWKGMMSQLELTDTSAEELLY